MDRRTSLALAAAGALTLALAACGQSVAGSGPATTTPPAAVPGSSTTPATPTTPTSTTGTPSSPAPASSPASRKPVAGAYISYGDYLADKATYDSSGKVVLFFHAGWCPTCQRAEGNITAERVPAGLTIVKTDYDSSDDLKRRYGVTVQHTFVQVAPDGTALKKFTGSDTAQEILDRTA